MLHRILAELQSSLTALVRHEPVTLAGAWSPALRRVSGGQLQTGSAPAAEVVDTFWRGTLACSAPFACMAFLQTSASLTWSKSHPANLEQPVELSVHAYVGHLPDRATFASAVAGARLPSMPISYSGDPAADVKLDLTGHMTGRVSRIAVAPQAEVYVCLLPGSMVRVGRKRVWHLRGELGAALPDHIRALFAGGRSGTIRSLA